MQKPVNTKQVKPTVKLVQPDYVSKKDAIKDAKLKQKFFPQIGTLYLLKRPKRGYFSVSKVYYEDNDLKDRIRKVIKI